MSTWILIAACLFVGCIVGFALAIYFVNIVMQEASAKIQRTNDSMEAMLKKIREASGL